MLPLNLSASVGRWSTFINRKTAKDYDKLSSRIFTRDVYACQFCGFQAKEYQELINLNHDYSNNQANNVVTSCVFCAQCHFLESVGQGDFGGGTLIYLPEVSQNQLNSLCHVLFCAMINDTAYRVTAQSIYRSLKFRSQVVDEVFGEGMSAPATFGQLLIDYQENQGKPEHVTAWMQKLRLLPSRVKFAKQIERWAVTALNEISSSD